MAPRANGTTGNGTGSVPGTGSQEAPTKPDRCGAQIASCCGPRACRLCCACCPPTHESTSTKFIYAVLLVVSCSLMSSLLIPKFQQRLQIMFRDFNATCIDLKIGINCMKLTGYMAIYKVSFAITFFFLAMCVLTVGVTSSKGVRASIHNGFWFFKILFIATTLQLIDSTTQCSATRQ